MRRASWSVPFDGVAVVALDPATALPTAEWASTAMTGSAGSRLMEIELREPEA